MQSARLSCTKVTANASSRPRGWTADTGRYRYRPGFLLALTDVEAMIQPMRPEGWHDNFLVALATAADIETQKTAWLEQRGYLPCPAELLCQLFDDSAIDDLLERGDVFSPTTDQTLRELSELAGRIDATEPPQRLLRSREWVRFVTVAARALEMARVDMASTPRSHT